MNAEEFVKYILDNKYKMYCMLCKTWTSTNQEEWKPCCYDYRNALSTMAHIQEVADKVEQ